MFRIALLLVVIPLAVSAEGVPHLVTTQHPQPVTELSAGKTADTQCIITQTECLNFPTYVGTFNDNYGWSPLVSSSCLPRAKEYSIWCGNRPGTPTTAIFKWADGKTMSANYVSRGTRCAITQSKCAAYPFYIGTFQDSFENSDLHATRCEARAKEYSIWCGNPPGVSTTSTFTGVDGDAVSSTYVAKSSCFIGQAYCRRYDGPVGVFPDNFDNSPFNASRCLARAKEYADYCANHRGDLTEAKFTHPDGSVVESTYIVP